MATTWRVSRADGTLYPEARRLLSREPGDPTSWLLSHKPAPTSWSVFGNAHQQLFEYIERFLAPFREYLRSPRAQLTHAIVAVFSRDADLVRKTGAFAWGVDDPEQARERGLYELQRLRYPSGVFRKRIQSEIVPELMERGEPLPSPSEWDGRIAQSILVALAGGVILFHDGRRVPLCELDLSQEPWSVVFTILDKLTPAVTNAVQDDLLGPGSRRQADTRKGRKREVLVEPVEAEAWAAQERTHLQEPDYLTDLWAEELGALAGLTPAESEVWERHWALKMTPTEIAEDLGKPPPTVRVHLHNARKKLRKAI